jgi:hypothetical protein
MSKPRGYIEKYTFPLGGGGEHIGLCHFGGKNTKWGTSKMWNILNFTGETGKSKGKFRLKG